MKVEIFLQRAGIDYHAAGDNQFQADCPLCGRKDKFYMNQVTGMWDCKVCYHDGGNLELLAGLLNVGLITKKTCVPHEAYMEKVRTAKNHVGEPERNVASFPETRLITRKRYPAYLNRRKVPYRLIKDHGVGMCHDGGAYNNRIIFPVNCNGSKSFVAYRTDDDETKPKTLDPFGIKKSQCIYLYDEMIATCCPACCLLVTEGLFDALRCLLFSYNAVALLGKSLSVKQARLLNSFPADEIIFMLDGGVSAKEYEKSMKNLSWITKRKTSHAIIPWKDKDPDNLTKQQMQLVVEARVNTLSEAINLKRRG